MDDETAIDQLIASFQRSYNAHRPSMVADLYAEDARWMAAAGPIFQGRPAITAALKQFMAAVPPVVALTERNKVVVGDRAVSHGTYTMTGEVGGEARSIGGSYLNALRRDGDAWRIVGQQMNYDVEMSAAMWVGRLEVVEALADEGTLTDLAEAFQARYNSGHVSRLVELFTQHAWVSFPGSTWETGRAAVSQVLQKGMEKSLRLDIHDLDTWELSAGMVVDVGWYELHAGGDRVQWGTYSLLARRSPEADWLIDWLVATASPGSL
jgi:uncharacterized protein (TIGR02246 family)